MYLDIRFNLNEIKERDKKKKFNSKIFTYKQSNSKKQNNISRIRGKSVYQRC